MASPMMIEFENNAHMAARLADVIEAQLARGIAEHGQASFAVSGGSTPEGLYKVLSTRAIDWSKVSVVLVDERWVAPGEQGSNETFVRNSLMQHDAALAKLVGLWADFPTPAAGLEAVRERFEKVATPFDAVVLGMGGDGHTASWFPHAEGLDAALNGDDQLVAVNAIQSEVTGAHTQRITLSLSAIKEAGFIGLLMAGAGKRAAYEKAIAGGDVADMPVRAILDARPDLWACWSA